MSGMSVGVPGTLRAWQKALHEFGTWPLRKALQPGIAAARHGFTVDPTFFLQTDEAKAIFADFPATAALYLDPDGSPRDVGTVIRNPDLARTYELIAAQGPRRPVLGPLAQAIVDTVKHPPLRPGSTRQVAPRRHGAQRPRRPTRRSTASRRTSATAGLDVYGMAPPSSRRLDRGRDPQHPRGLSTSARCRASSALHYYLEASRLAYADRGAFLADPGYVSVPLAQLLSDQFAAQRRAKITETRGDLARRRPATRAP